MDKKPDSSSTLPVSSAVETSTPSSSKDHPDAEFGEHHEAKNEADDREEEKKATENQDTESRNTDDTRLSLDLLQEMSERSESSQGGPITDLHGRDSKWGERGIEADEIALESRHQRRRERWFSSTAFKSGIAMLAVVGIIGIIVGVAASQSKDEMKSARVAGGNNVKEARHLSLECDTDPPEPGLSCISDDWDSLDRSEGTRVFYRCESLPSKVIVRIVECDGFMWIDKFNKVKNCHCDK